MPRNTLKWKTRPRIKRVNGLFPVEGDEGPISILLSTYRWEVGIKGRLSLTTRLHVKILPLLPPKNLCWRCWLETTPFLLISPCSIIIWKWIGNRLGSYEYRINKKLRGDDLWKYTIKDILLKQQYLACNVERVIQSEHLFPLLVLDIQTTS